MKEENRVVFFFFLEHVVGKESGKLFDYLNN